MAENTETPWFTQDAGEVVAALSSDRDAGLTDAEAQRRLAEHGPNAIAAEPAPSVWQRKQSVRDGYVQVWVPTVFDLPAAGRRTASVPWVFHS